MKSRIRCALVIAIVASSIAPCHSHAGDTLFGKSITDITPDDDKGTVQAERETLWAPRQSGRVFDPSRDAPEIRNFRAGFAPCGDAEKAEDRSFEGVCLGFCDFVSRWFERVARKSNESRTYRLQPEARETIAAELHRYSPNGCIKWYGAQEKPPLDGIAYVQDKAKATMATSSLRKISQAHPDAVKRAIMGHHFILSGITMLDRRSESKKRNIRLNRVPGGKVWAMKKTVKAMARHLEKHGTMILAMARCPGGNFEDDWRRLDPPHAVLLYKITRVETSSPRRYRLHIYDSSSFYAAWHGERTEYLDYTPSTGSLVFNGAWNALGEVDDRFTLLWTCDLHDGHVAADSLANYASVADVFGLGVELPDPSARSARQ